MISARDAASIYKISGTTGEVLWKLGGLPGITTSDFKTENNLTFSFQHHARFLVDSTNSSKQVLSFFDNSAHGSENDIDRIFKSLNFSSAKVIEVDVKNWQANLLFNGILEDQLLAKSQGSTQVLPNGNVFTNWGSEGAITEFNRKEEVVFPAYLDSTYGEKDVQNYRAFKFNWTGVPNEAIAVFAENLADDSTTYVSWNGDTRTKKWKFYLLVNNFETFIGESRKLGFETSLGLNKKIDGKIIAKAYDDREALLCVSNTTSPEDDSIPYSIPYSGDLHIILDQDPKFSQNYFSWKKYSLVN